MTPHRKTIPTDRLMLQLMDLRDTGMTMLQIATAMGITKGTVSGILFRIDRDLAASEATQ